MRWAKVFVDGKEIDNVETADEEQGIVVFYPKENGELIIDGDEIRREMLTGTVGLKINRDAPEWVKELAPKRVET
ncbi:hypothetical protein NKG99_03815 [Mesorhizobium sp. M1409]|uniref:hypothetical protein n=1 Tax=Mesorhizobium sp. M1409 TaxID=2957100 RepID=UPI00333B587D